MAEAKKTDVDDIVNQYLKGRDIRPELKEPTTDLARKMVSHPCFGNPDFKWSLDDFELGNRLGRGKFGRVFVAREKITGFIVAVKSLQKKDERQILREIEIQSHLKHPNVLQLLCWFHDSHRIYLVVEYAGQGELYKHLKGSPGGRFDQHLTAKYIYQVADAVHYCHQNQVIHCDVNPENLLLTFDDDVKLGDFGWSVHSPSLKRSTMGGTLDYLPPEMVENKAYGKFVDHWCLGILCYEFLVGNPPFESIQKEDTYQKTTTTKDVQFPESVPDGARHLISKLLIRNAKKRLTLPQVMSHTWILANK